ncbi:MAG TPA: nucleoside 2-deoxyribosyltransferase [Prolixibacteraceae bacterium]|nr:nucleoside 2-deoxyribosyltransferase [Prolixibacteraceae bacterium]
MKIYFSGSIRGGREDAEIYVRLIAYLKQYGSVLTEHVGNSQLTPGGEDRFSKRAIHDRDLDWLLEADAVVAEATVPSLGVGYEIGRAVENGVPVLCLFRPSSGRQLSAMIAGSPNVSCVDYSTEEEACQAITRFLKKVK